MIFKKTPIIVTFILLSLALVLSACGGSSEAAENTTSPADNTTAVVETDGDAKKGKALFTQTCSPCHGANAEGVTGLGPNLHKNAFISGLDDAALA